MKCECNTFYPVLVRLQRTSDEFQEIQGISSEYTVLRVIRGRRNDETIYLAFAS